MTSKNNRLAGLAKEFDALLAASSSTLVVYEFTSTAGQTVFTGADNNGVALTYLPGSVLIALNGFMLQKTSDYTATNGTSITLTSSSSGDELLQVFAFGTFTVANHYTKAESDALRATIYQAGSGYIEGLIPLWVTATEINITAGSAYIPSLGRNISAPAVNLSGLVLSANTWYYLYLYDLAGVATYELVTTAPSAPYTGTARTKAGVNSRRFISALRTGSSALRPFLWAADYVNYLDAAASYLTLNASTQVGPITVSAAAAMPPTTRRALMQVYAAVGNTFNLGLAFDTFLLSVKADTRVLAPVISLPDQAFVYGHVGAVTGGTSLDVRGYGSER